MRFLLLLFWEPFLFRLSHSIKVALADDAHYIAGLLILGIRAAHKKINQLKIGALKEMHVLTLPLLVKAEKVLLYKGIEHDIYLMHAPS